MVHLSILATVNLKKRVIDGHIIAIDLSEPMDRIVDKDEDLEYLDEYKFMNPHTCNGALNIAQGGDAVLKAFEEGFRNARIGQYRCQTKDGTGVN